MGNGASSKIVVIREGSTSKPGTNPALDFFELLAKFQPLEIVEEIAVTVVIIVVLLFLWKHQDRVIYVFTGDDRIHGTLGDLLWWGCCRCCGTCSHDWTRCFTRLPCCPTGLYGANLVRVFGTFVGVATHTIEISNIVAGDLPYKERGNFYVSIECSANPPMVTSVLENKPAKAAHFGEVITLRVRESPLEKNIKITVFAMDVIGSVDLCELHVSCMNVVQWARDTANPVKRFAMVPIDKTYELSTPPWIALEFGFPYYDHRHLEGFHNDGNTVRTATWAGDGTEPWRDTDMATFKHQYALVDTGGNAIQEPLEEDMAFIQKMRLSVYHSVRCTSCLIVVVVVVILFLRLYSGSCYTHYYVLTQSLRGATGRNTTPPVATAMLEATQAYCDQNFGGMALDPGTHPCRPSFEQVNYTCTHLPETQRKPSAFVDLTSKGFYGIVEPLQCVPNVCTYFHYMAAWDRTLFLSCFVLFFVNVFCLRPCANQAVEVCRKRLVNQRNAGLRRRAMLPTQTTQSRPGGTYW